MNNLTTDTNAIARNLDASTAFQNAPKTITEKFIANLKSLRSNKTFNALNIPFAHESYLISKYSTIQSNEKRVDTYMATLARKIDDENRRNGFLLLEEIPLDLIEFSDIIIKFFRDKGYIAHDMNKLIEGLSHHFIFLYWGNYHLAQQSININEVAEKTEE